MFGAGGARRRLGPEQRTNAQLLRTLAGDAGDVFSAANGHRFLRGTAKLAWEFGGPSVL